MVISQEDEQNFPEQGGSRTTMSRLKLGFHISSSQMKQFRFYNHTKFAVLKYNMALMAQP